MYTVNRWELILASAAIERFIVLRKDFVVWLRHARIYVGRLFDARQHDDRRLAITHEVHSVRSDATPSNMLLGQKIHVCELTSVYFPDDDGEPRVRHEASKAWERVHKIYADSVLVPDRFRGLECADMLHKQLTSVGLSPPWPRRGEAAAPAVVAESEQDKEERLELESECAELLEAADRMVHVHIKAWIFVSDQGPDPVGANHVIEPAMRDSDFDWWLRQYCTRNVFGKQLNSELAQ